MQFQEVFVVTFLFLMLICGLPIKKPQVPNTKHLYLLNELSLVLQGEKNQTSNEDIDYFGYDNETPHEEVGFITRPGENSEGTSNILQTKQRLDMISTQLDSFYNDTSFDNVAFELAENGLNKELSHVEETVQVAPSQTWNEVQEQTKKERNFYHKMSMSAKILKRLDAMKSPGITSARKIVAIELRVLRNRENPGFVRKELATRGILLKLWKEIAERSEPFRIPAWRRLRELWNGGP